MTERYKRLGSIAPAASETALYTVPTGIVAIVSVCVVANRDTAQGTVRITHSADGAATATTDDLVPTAKVDPNTSIECLKGIVLEETDVVRVTPSTANFTINLYGVERDIS